MCVDAGQKGERWQEGWQEEERPYSELAVCYYLQRQGLVCTHVPRMLADITCGITCWSVLHPCSSLASNSHFNIQSCMKNTMVTLCPIDVVPLLTFLFAAYHGIPRLTAPWSLCTLSWFPMASWCATPARCTLETTWARAVSWGPH